MYGLLYGSVANVAQTHPFRIEIVLEPGSFIVATNDNIPV